MRDPGIEPGSVPWQGTILPLNQPRSLWRANLAIFAVYNQVNLHFFPADRRHSGGRQAAGKRNHV